MKENKHSRTTDSKMSFSTNNFAQQFLLTQQYNELHMAMFHHNVVEMNQQD